MRKKIKKNIIYLLLPFVFVLIILSFIFRNKTQTQLEIGIFAIIIYVSLAMVHHFFDKSLTLETTFEYILIALLATIMLVGVM